MEEKAPPENFIQFACLQTLIKNDSVLGFFSNLERPQEKTGEYDFVLLLMQLPHSPSKAVQGLFT